MATHHEPAAPPRAPLTRDRIMRAALELVDERDIESLSMRRLARALGFEAMALYHHVDGKDDVIAGILDIVLDEMEPPSSKGSWDAAVRASAISVHAALGRHPWASSLLLSSRHGMRPARVRYTDALLRRLRDGLESADATYHAYHVLDAHIFGFSYWQASHSAAAPDLENAAELLRGLPVDEYPDLAQHVRQHLAEGDDPQVSAFEFALDLILDGLRRMRGRRSVAGER